MDTENWFPIKIRDYPYAVRALEGAINGQTVLAGIEIRVPADGTAGEPVERLKKTVLNKLPLLLVARKLMLAVGEDELALPTIHPGKLTWDDYHWIAVIYDDAVECGLSPHKEIARRFDTNVNTSRTWVKRARQMGLLPPARRGRAGSAASPVGS